MPWEYLIIESVTPINNDSKLKSKILNRHGADDWECFSIRDKNTNTEFLFKRFVKPPSKRRSAPKKDAVKKE